MNGLEQRFKAEVITWGCEIEKKADSRVTERDCRTSASSSVCLRLLSHKERINYTYSLGLYEV